MKFLPVCEPLLLGNEEKYVNQALSTGWISSSGSFIPDFERSFSYYCGVKHGIAVSNGTVALHLALVALSIGAGDEVIIPNFTMIATAFSVCYTGATPIYVDAHPHTWNISVDEIESKITSATRAIIVVHIFGTPCNMNAIRTIAKRHNLYIIEDAAEAHGAEYRGSKAGSLSQIAAFSFFANKNITTGEGGMVLTDDDDLAERCRYHRNLCFSLNEPRNYTHNHIGFNYRMSNLHAAIGLAQTERADFYRELKIKNGNLYRTLLSQIPGIQLQQIDEKDEAVFWMNGFVIEKEYGRSREELIQHLKENQIDSRVFFQGMNRQQSLKKYSKCVDRDYPQSDRLADRGLYLPSGGGLTEDEIKRICLIVSNFRKRPRHPYSKARKPLTLKENT